MSKPLPITPFAAALDIKFVGGIAGRYLLPAGGNSVYSCRSTSLSTASVVISGAVAGRPGDRAILRLEHIGTLNATITQIVPGGFRADLVISEEDRPLLAAKINWLKRRSLKQADNKREGQRIVPRDPKGFLYIDAAEHECFIIDVSASGAGVSTQIVPPIGAAVSVGTIQGHVVRHMEGGFGVQFDEVQAPETLLETIAARRPAATVAAAG